ncbi:TIGR01244 family sulfur transferase [Pontixanthobacter sp.]|uniref:TIGR01244 family sulfur transferase n=1 Tax=Pontixanthobacter sp. TaxID=2792078 RepID=UPI003C7AD3CF
MTRSKPVDAADLKQLGPVLTVTGQIAPPDVQALAELGYRSIIGNRPDGEEADQPDWQSIAVAAEQAGMDARHIPVGGDFTVQDQSARFARALADMPTPILAYCRTGNRSTQLFEAVSGTTDGQQAQE